MSITLSLPNDPNPLPTPSYSATSLDPPPSTSSSSVDSMRPKPERRVSLGVLESAKFRLSHDVGVPVPSMLSPFFPLPCLTRVGRTLFFPVCPSCQVTQLGLLKVKSHRKDGRELLYLILSLKRVFPWSPLTSLLPAPTEHTRLARVGLRL